MEGVSKEWKSESREWAENIAGNYGKIVWKDRRNEFDMYDENDVVFDMVEAARDLGIENVQRVRNWVDNYIAPCDYRDPETLYQVLLTVYEEEREEKNWGK